jgi:hypothetical protein
MKTEILMTNTLIQVVRLQDLLELHVHLLLPKRSLHQHRLLMEQLRSFGPQPNLANHYLEDELANATKEIRVSRRTTTVVETQTTILPQVHHQVLLLQLLHPLRLQIRRIPRNLGRRVSNGLKRWFNRM